MDGEKFQMTTGNSPTKTNRDSKDLVDSDRSADLLIDSVEDYYSINVRQENSLCETLQSLMKH